MRKLLKQIANHLVLAASLVTSILLFVGFACINRAVYCSVMDLRGCVALFLWAVLWAIGGLWSLWTGGSRRMVFGASVLSLLLLGAMVLMFLGIRPAYTANAGMDLVRSATGCSIVQRDPEGPTLSTDPPIGPFLSSGYVFLATDSKGHTQRFFVNPASGEVQPLSS